jgi:excinuclease ABC subunit A
VDTPYQALSAEHKKIVLYGSGKDTIDFSKIKGRNGWSNKPKPYILNTQTITTLTGANRIIK